MQNLDWKTLENLQKKMRANFESDVIFCHFQVVFDSPLIVYILRLYYFVNSTIIASHHNLFSLLRSV